MARRNKHTHAHRTRRGSIRLAGLLSVLTAAALLGGVGPSARAAGFVYQQHTLNAGVLVNGTDLAPYVFYVLNSRPDIRPPDVALVNPLAPATASPATASYWEVPINSVSDGELSQYNVLYLRADGVSFGPAINEKLRRYVDNGGQLIVEYGAATAVTSGLFTGTTGSGTPAATVPLGTSLRHPILSQPYFLSDTDVAALTVQPSGGAGNIASNTSDSLHAAQYANLFTPVLSDTGGAVLSAAPLGAGQVVVTTLSLGTGGVPTNNAVTFAPTDLYKVSDADLKLLANILNWAAARPSGETKNSHGDGSSSGLASFSPAWQFPTQAGNTPPPAAVWGNFVFAVDAAGVLRAFDAYPAENLTGGVATTGAETMLSTYPTTSYDQIWNSSAVSPSVTLGVGTSAPVVASFSNNTYVFVEKRDGTLKAFNAVTGAAGPSLTAPAAGGTFGGNAPAPAYCEGRLYAGQANGTLHVYDLNEGTSAAVPLNPSPPAASATPEAVTGAPVVGYLNSGDTNVLTALVPTNYNLYTVLLGAKNEPLVLHHMTGGVDGYSIARAPRYDLANIFADLNLNAVPPLQAYDYSGVVQGNAGPPNPAPSSQDPLFPLPGTLGLYTDWNMDFADSVFAGAGSTPVPVSLSFVSATSSGGLSATALTPASALSAPAIDRRGDYYYTENLPAPSGAINSYLVGVTNAILYGNVHVKFRFRLPQTNETVTDGDNVNYDKLKGFRFVGAPVVDDSGNVYAAATDGTKSTVVCLRANQAIFATPFPAAPTVDISQDTVTQPDENGGPDNTIQRGPDTNIGASNAVYGQFIAAPGSLTFYNFDRRSPAPKQLVGTVTEPQGLSATSTDGSAHLTPLSMHTNLAWFVEPFVTRRISGLTQVGNSLLLTDGANLYRLSTKPIVSSTPPTVKVAIGPLPFVTPLGAGTVGSPPSAGGAVLTINSSTGLAARTRQVTVIADGSRVLGVDGDGGAVWAVDATTRTDTNLSATTKVPFSHPTSLSQFALNDYLVADTGSNRCVRFDSAGNVQWELTRFTDPAGLMGVGQPLTISQPTSVVTRQAIVPAAAAQYAGDAATYYLVADSGNDRLVEVADFVNPTTGKVDASHVLTWVSHTKDRDGRSYRYGSAAYYPNTTTPSGYSIAATITNTRLAPLTASGLGPISGDSPGGCLAVFNYPKTPTAFSAITPATPSDLVYTAAGFYTQEAGGYTPYTIKNPRFLQLYTPSGTPTAPATGVPAFDFLYADDNGVFDLTYLADQEEFVATTDRLQFTATDYHGMANPAFGVSGAVTRTTLPFIPTCVQGLGLDTTPGIAGGAATTTRRYLITQSYAQGELGAAPGKIGGEIFEVDVNTGSTPAVTTPGGFAGGATLSHPDYTGPLTQPTFGVRLP